MAGVHIYSLLCERMFGRRPARVQLLYLSKPERIITAPSDQSLRGVDVKTNAVMQAVRQACKRDDFRPRTSALCNYCSFQEFCPEFDGQAGARPAHAARPPGRARGSPAAAARLCMTLVASASPRSTRRSTAASTPFRTPAVDKVAYRLSSAADHSLLWHTCGVGPRPRARRRRRAGGAILGRDGRRVGAHERRGEVAVPPGPARRLRRHRVPPRPAPARSRARSRPATPPPRSARRRSSAAARAGTPRPPRSPRPASTSGCTTRPTSSPAPPSASPSGLALRPFVNGIRNAGGMTTMLVRLRPRRS